MYIIKINMTKSYMNDEQESFELPFKEITEIKPIGAMIYPIGQNGDKKVSIAEVFPDGILIPIFVDPHNREKLNKVVDMLNNLPIGTRSTFVCLKYEGEKQVITIIKTEKEILDELKQPRFIERELVTGLEG